MKISFFFQTFIFILPSILFGQTTTDTIVETQLIVTECGMEAPKREKPPGVPPPPPPPPVPIHDENFFGCVVETMPRFSGCDAEGLNRADLRKCSDEKLLTFMSENLIYPPIAKDNGVQGMVVVSFIIEKDGSISNARVVREIGANCGQAALDLINKMPDWIPGEQRGRAVRVQYNLPVRFELEKCHSN